MKDSLFDLPESKSPRLRWMERHHLKVEQSPEDVCSIDGNCDFVVFHGMKPVAYGRNPETALTNAAKKLNIRLWNEE